MSEPCSVCGNRLEDKVPGWCPACGSYPPPSYPWPWASIFVLLLLIAAALAAVGMGFSPGW